ncbi:MAG TPA: chromosome segregation SMC family protein [Nitrososphaerales archaeon]|nr:chromosome segregation SMC family protein [Nitrososphaerales archaeon]
MVYLKKIETKGFKSMGPKQMTIPVENGFVAITGPNGSGKSNLLDAVLFALGENSAKTLRVPNLGALIYDGSVEEQKPSSARVTLQFDNSDRRIPVDTDSVSITRELKISGESNYYLNGKHIQRNNLSELLEMALITSRGLNIVLQGMITRISELIPDEKRKLIEQMVGVAQFDEKKNMALTQLNEADRKLEIAMAKIGEIRDRVQQLEQERNDQLRVKQLEDQIGWLRAASVSTRLANVRRSIEQKRIVVSDSATKLQQLQVHLTEITSSVESFDQERSQLIKSAMDAGAARVELELGKLKNEIESLKRQRQEAVDYVDKIRQVLPTLNQMATSQETRIAESEQQIQSLQQKLTDAESLKTIWQTKQNELSAERAQFEKEISVAQSRLGQLRKFKDLQDTKLQTSKDRSNKLVSDLRSSQDRRLSIQDKIKFFEENLTSAQKSISDLDTLLTYQRNELNGLRQSRTNMDKLSKRVEEQLNIALMILEKAQEAVRGYDSEMTALENVAGDEIAIAKLNSLGQSSALQGYYGPLRNLIRFSDDYSKAIAAIGRDWLNAIIVKDVQSLLKVSQAAKKLRISRLTTVPLSEVGEIASHQEPKSPGVVRYVTDVIECDPGLKSLINFVFGDSVIVDSPKSAFMIARKGFRAVTLAGDVFEPDILAFETGYSAKYTQLAELLNQQAGYEGIKDVLGSLRTLIEKRKNAIINLHAKAQSHESNEREHDMQISRIETKLETTKQFVSKYSQDAKTLNDRLKSTLEEIGKLEDERTIVERRLTGIELGARKLSSMLSAFDFSAFDQRSAEINKRRMELDSKLEAAIAEIRDIATEITRARGDLENNQRPSLERLRQQSSESESKFAERSKFLEDSEPKLRQLEAGLASLMEREAETIDRAAKYQPMLDSIDTKLKSLKVEEESVRRSLSQADKEYFSTTNDLNRLLDNERNLVGELSIFGYAEPIEAFEGADELLRELNGEFNALRNNVNFNADKNYREIFENYKYSSVRKNELEKERNAIVTFIETIDTEKRKVFMDAFEKIDKEIRIIFTKITGGNAWLEIEKPDSIFDSGVFLMAQFPGKLPRDSSSVSGGEKTMSAISFILAIQAVFPSPFYLFDEVDAHLDSVYSGKFAGILAERCAFAQIVIVSLKDTVVSKATSVIGVYMTQGSSKVIRYKSGMEVEVKSE